MAGCTSVLQRLMHYRGLGHSTTRQLSFLTENSCRKHTQQESKINDKVTLASFACPLMFQTMEMRLNAKDQRFENLHSRTISSLTFNNYISNSNFVPLRGNTQITCWGTFVNSVFYTPVRLMSKRGNKQKANNVEGTESNDDDDDDWDDDDDDDIEDSEFGKFFEEDEEFSNKYKQIKKPVKSLRMDAIISAGFSIARNNVDNHLYTNKLRVNKNKVTKKSKQLKEGDCIDLISEVIDNGSKIKVKRIRIVTVSESKSKKGNVIVYLRCWRANTVIDNYNEDSGKWESK